MLHVSDVHFGSEDAPAAAAAAAFARDLDPVVTIVSGDLTMNGLPREFVAAAAWLRSLPHPMVVTPGNHDTPYWNLPLRALSPFGRYRKWIGDPATAAFDAETVRVRCINTARGAQPRPDWSKGAIDLRACRAAAAALSAADFQGLRIVSCHHPLLEAPGAPVSGGVHRGALAAAVLAEGGVDLILTGHVHVPFAVPLTTPDARIHAVGAGTLSTRIRGVPPGFNVLTWDSVETRVQPYEWIDARFEPAEPWILPRRPSPAS